MNSTHKVEVFRVGPVTKHPNADRLGVITVFDNYQAIIGLNDFHEGDLAAYIPPDSVVPDTEEFKFLDGHRRIRAKKLRGIISMGLVIKAPLGSREGDDVAEKLGITHYEPPKRSSAFSTDSRSNKHKKYSSFVKGPDFQGPNYDLESWYRYGSVIPDGTIVEITEKIHGTNARFTWQHNRLWVASRSGYRRSERRDAGTFKRFWHRLTFRSISETLEYWRVVDQQPWIEKLCKAYPGRIFYGEIFGDVQDLKYGAANGELYLQIFDIFDPAFNRFVNPSVRHEMVENPDYHVPILNNYFEYNKEGIKELISGKSLFYPNQIREGIVIKPSQEQWNPKIGRVALKAVSPEYLEREI